MLLIAIDTSIMLGADNKPMTGLVAGLEGGDVVAAPIRHRDEPRALGCMAYRLHRIGPEPPLVPTRARALRVSFPGAGTRT